MSLLLLFKGEGGEPTPFEANIDLPSGLVAFAGASLEVANPAAELAIDGPLLSLNIQAHNAALNIDGPASLSLNAPATSLDLDDPDAKVNVDG